MDRERFHRILLDTKKKKAGYKTVFKHKSLKIKYAGKP